MLKGIVLLSQDRRSIVLELLLVGTLTLELSLLTGLHGKNPKEGRLNKILNIGAVCRDPDQISS